MLCLLSAMFAAPHVFKLNKIIFLFSAKNQFVISNGLSLKFIPLKMNRFHSITSPLTQLDQSFSIIPYSGVSLFVEVQLLL